MICTDNEVIEHLRLYDEASVKQGFGLQSLQG